jgi:DNA-binding IclR family transcriptional regulator
LYAGAGGKVLLAYAPEEFRDRVLHQTLKKFTPKTIVERDRLEKNFETIRRQGYSITRGELFSEVGGMAAPVFDHNNRVCASMTIAGPKHRFTEDRCRQMLKSLLSSAKKLSFLLGNAG